MLNVKAGTIWDSKYRIEGEIGRGGTCEVFKAVDIETERLVALKVLAENQNVLRFKREFRSMAKMHHPNIAVVYESGMFRDRAYYTMEFIDGGDLKHRFRNLFPRAENGRRIPVRQAHFKELSRLFCEICAPLKYIHSKKIIHRDLKPANIMVTSDHRLKLMDFGLVKELGIIQESLTQTGMFVGTVAYMSPEQGLGRKLDQRSDLYSLGVVLYELMTQRLPFQGSTVLEVFMKHIKELPAPPVEINPNIPGILNRLTMILLQKDPAKRLKSAGEVADYFEYYLKSDPGKVSEITQIKITAAPETTPEFETEPALFSPALVGRDAVMEKVGGVFTAPVPPSNIVIIKSEPGMGKSRLLRELGNTARLNGYTVLSGACSEIEHFAYSAFFHPLEMISARLNSMEKKDALEALQGNTGILIQVSPAFERIQWLDNVPKPEKLEPHKDKLRTFDAIRNLLFTLASRRKILITLDDIHWGDDLSLELLHYLNRSLLTEKNPEIQLVIIATVRSDLIKANPVLKKILWNFEYLKEAENISLDPLDRAEVMRLISGILGQEELDSALVDFIYEKSGGNPLFIEEMVKGLVESQQLIWRNRKWEFLIKSTLEFSLARQVEDSLSIAGMQIPKRIRYLISNRIENLDSGTRHILGLAAIIGNRFAFDILQEISGLSEGELLDKLDTMIHEEIIEEVVISGKEFFRFKNKMMRDVLLSSMQKRRKTRTHLKIARAMISLHGADNPDNQVVLAYHFDQGKDAESAVKFYLNAARKAEKRYLNQYATIYCKRILELLPGTALPESEKVQYYKECHRILGSCYEATGHPEDALQEYEELRRLGIAHDDKSLEALGYYYKGGIYQDWGEFNRALELSEKAIALFSETDRDEKRLASAMALQAGSQMHLGFYEDAEKKYMEINEMMKRLDDASGKAMCALNIGMLKFNLGKYEDAYRWISSSVKAYERLKDRYRMAKGLVNLAVIYNVWGDVEKSLSVMLKALDISRKIGDLFSIAVIQGNLGRIYFDSGRFDQSENSLNESIKIARQLGDKPGVAIGLINLTNLLIEQGKYGGSEAAIREAKQLASEMKDKRLLSFVLFQQAELYLAEKKIGPSESLFTECSGLSDKIGLISLTLQCRAAMLYLNMVKQKQELPQAGIQDLLSRADSLEDTDAILRIGYYVAKMYKLANQSGKGLEFAESYLNKCGDKASVSWKWRYAALLASLYMDVGRIDEMEKQCKHACRILSDMLHGIKKSDAGVFLKQPEILEFRKLLLRFGVRNYSRFLFSDTET